MRGDDLPAYPIRVAPVSLMMTSQQGANKMDIRTQIEQRINAEKAKREARGLLIEWNIPGRGYWSAYASSNAVKEKWINAGNAKGWELINASRSN